MKLYKLKTKRDMAEIHQYVEDLKTVTNLRRHALSSGIGGEDELARYDTTLEVMQLVLIELNS